MKKQLIKIILAVLLFLSCQSVFAKDLSIAPDFTLSDTQNKTVTLSNYKNKQPVLLFFWATWCPFCREEFKGLNNDYSDLVRDNVELLAIDIGEPVAKVNNFTKNFVVVFKVLLDQDSAAASSYNLVGIPTFILINKNGEIVFRDHYFPKQYKNLLSNLK